MQLDLHDIAHALRGDVCGDQVLFPGPGHSEKDRSGSFRFAPERKEGFVVFDHSDQSPEAWKRLKDYVKKALGGEFKFAPAKEADPAEVQRKIERAINTWEYGRNPRGTPVEKYLARRGLSIPEEAADTAIRFVPYCPFGKGQKVPAMVCLVRSQDDQPLGIHRTALSHEGEKVFRDVFGKQECRMAQGPVSGGAVKFGKPTEILGIGEGIESTLSLRAFKDIPVWSLLNANGVASFPVIDGIKTLVVAVDNDRAGRQAFKDVARRWIEAGREVVSAMHPDEGKDLNDLVMGGRHGR